MDIYDSEDKLIKRIDSISDDMARFISKEGCNQFPTVLFLANRMFVSDDINLIKDLNLDIKLKKGDNYYWHKSKLRLPVCGVCSSLFMGFLLSAQICAKLILFSNICK